MNKKVIFGIITVIVIICIGIGVYCYVNNNEDSSEGVIKVNNEQDTSDTSNTENPSATENVE